MKKRVGIITFHASHNYGSMLQAYALQQVILNMGFDCEIINFRTERQKYYYKPCFYRGTIQGKVKRYLLLFPYYKPLLEKFNLFEDFLKDDLLLTLKEYSSLTELENENFQYDFFISGSDQIWNTSCLDFDWAYYLSFVHTGKKIAYAPSMGPYAEGVILSQNYKKIKELLSSYSSLSVREEGTARWIKKHCDFDVDINLDPTLLLDSETWNTIIDSKPLICEDYIFVYAPFFNLEVLKMADRLSKRYNMKVVLSQIYDAHIWECYKFILSNNRFVVKLNVGPKEFLNLCKYARLICGYSFHLVAFSVLFHIPFLALNGMKDNRIANLLNMLSLQYRSVDADYALNRDLDLFDMSFNNVDLKISRYRERSLLWLNRALIGDE